MFKFLFYCLTDANIHVGAVYKITVHAQLYAEKKYMKKLQCIIMTKIRFG